MTRIDVKCVIVCTTTPDHLKIGVVEDPIKRFFRHQNLNEFSEDDTKKMIMSILSKTRIRLKMSRPVLTIIHNKTKGHPYYIAVFMYEIIKSKSKGNFNVNNFNKLYPGIIKQLKVNLDNTYNNISDKEDGVIQKLIKLKKTIFSPSDIKVKNIGSVFSSLDEKEIIHKVSRGRYRWNHPLLRDYFREKFHENRDN